MFLGQLGGSSEYLRKKMAASQIARRVKILHSQSGKLNVVKGAMADRLQLSETFVRKFKTIKSYGTQLLMEWYPGSEAHQFFPNAQDEGAIFERPDGHTWLKVIEWAISKVCAHTISMVDQILTVHKLGYHAGQWIYEG